MIALPLISLLWMAPLGIQDPTTTLDNALRALREGRPEQTIVLLEPLLGSGSSNVARLLGHAYRKRGRLDEALMAYRAAGSNDPEILRGLLEIHRTRSDSAAIIGTARLLLARDPGDLALRQLLANVHRDSGDSAAAEAERHRILERDPTAVRSRLILGELLAERGRPARAAFQLELVRLLGGPDIPETTAVLIARLYRQANSPTRSEHWYDVAAQETPRRRLPGERIEQWMETGRLERARTAAQTLATTRRHRTLGRIALAEGDRDRALTEFRQALASGAEERELHRFVGLSLLSGEERAAARPHLLRVISEGPDSGCHRALIDLFLEDEDGSRAREHLILYLSRHGEQALDPEVWRRLAALTPR